MSVCDTYFYRLSPNSLRFLNRVPIFFALSNWESAALTADLYVRSVQGELISLRRSLPDLALENVGARA